MLLDVHLPDMAGIDVLRRLRANPVTSGVPVVALSADASAKQVRLMIEEGAVAYLYKPIDVGELERTSVPYSRGDRHFLRRRRSSCSACLTGYLDF